MTRRIHIAVCLIQALLLALAALPVRAQDSIVVDPNGVVPTLTLALQQVTPGGRITVQPGVYREPTLAVDKPVTIVGMPGAVLDGEGQRQIMTVTADSVVLRGLTFRDVGVSYVEDRAAVKVEEGHHCLIEGNTFERTFFAIYLAQTAGCRIVGNTMVAEGPRQTASGNGIHLWYSRDAVIEGNHIRGHRDGIYLEFVEDAQVRGNVSEGNLRYGLHFMFSDRCHYEGNTFADNDAGVAVMYSKGVAMAENRFERNWGSASFGLLLKDITDSQVVGNTFVGNTVALYAEAVNRTQVSGNGFEENGWAVKVMANGQDNHFTRNTFIGNTFDVATNGRSNYSTFAENYWDRYNGYDLDRDGFGDVPFRPVRLFSLLVEQNEPSLILLRSFFVDLLDAAERVLPLLTPETLIDPHPRMTPEPPRGASHGRADAKVGDLSATFTLSNAEGLEIQP